jgi:hypothetical protein
VFKLTQEVKMPEEIKKSSFPTPMIATSKAEPQSLDLEKIDMSRQGVQGNAVVTKGPAATFVTRVSDGKTGQ